MFMDAIVCGHEMGGGVIYVATGEGGGLNS